MAAGGDPGAEDREAVSGFVDIHSHLLPGIDDGPPDLAGSLEMAASAAGAGTAVLCATPHLRSDFPGVAIGELAERAAAVQGEIEEAGIALRVVQAAETSLIWALEASEEDLRRATFGAQGKDLLVETPGDVSMIEQLLYQVRLRGVRVALAHPERSHTFQGDLERLVRLHEQGILLQVNAGALLAPRRSAARGLAERLCREGLAHALASDGHTGGERRPVANLALGVQALRELVGAERAAWMARDAPLAIVEGRPLPEAPAIQGSRRGWRRFR